MQKNITWTGSTLVAVLYEVCDQGTFIHRALNCLWTGHAATIATLSYAIRFWSKGTKRALFLRHEGFL